MTSLAKDPGSSGTAAIVRSSVSDQDTHHSKERMIVEPRNTQSTSNTLSDRPNPTSADPEDPPNILHLLLRQTHKHTVSVFPAPDKCSSSLP
ncbi:hypothetical protein V866_008431 [Kwoniella sp. B9012]